MSSHQSHSCEETVQLGKALSATLKCGDVVALSGDLGTGKTQFIAGVCEGLGVRVRVTSPTFTIINEYPADVCTVVHVDLYRISSAREFIGLGIEEYICERYICLIEWAERMAEFLPRSCVHVKLAYHEGDHDRVVLIDRVTENAEKAGDIAV